MQVILFVDEFTGDVSELDPDVLWVVEWGIQVEVFNVKAYNFCSWVGGDAVEEELDNLKVSGLHAGVS